MEAKGINRRSPINITKGLKRRFWSRVNVGFANECWNWNASMRNGYGAIKHEKKVISAHRLAYILAKGEPHDSLVIGHTCDNRACCNPRHLEAITPGTNNRDARGRLKFHMTRGTDCPQSVLNDEAVLEMRRANAGGESIRSISQRVGVSPSAARDAIRGVTWSHVKEPV